MVTFHLDPINYQRHYSEDYACEYKYMENHLCPDEQIYYNYYDNWESKLNMFLIKNTI